jgi:FkbM family methyltransferase
MHPWIRRTAYALLPRAARLEFMKLYYLGQHRRRAGEEPEMRTLASFVAPGDCVVDVGANVGFYTVRLSEAVGIQGTVHAFEPVPETFAILSATVRRLPLSNVVLHASALSDHSGTAEIVVPREAGGADNLYLAHLAGKAAPPGRRTRIETVTLDEFRRNGLPRISFIKCDVEGAELLVLRGALAVLREDRPVMLCEVCGHAKRFQTTPGDVFAFIQTIGYRAMRLDGEVLVNCSDPIPEVENYFFMPA